MSEEEIGRMASLIVEWWRSGNSRDFPWRRKASPWHILVAEVLLIQTDAPRVAAVYSEFVRRYPTPKDLARAPLSEVEEVLRPLGLFRQRARRLKAIAEELCREYGCFVPSSYSELRRLPGVGEYIASAVMLFAFNEPRPLVDINIARVLCRVALGRDPPKRYMYDSTVRSLAESLEWGREVALAFIDFAAAVCLSRNPKCSECPVASLCKYSSR